MRLGTSGEVELIRAGQIPDSWQTSDTMMRILLGLCRLEEKDRFQVRCEVDERLMVQQASSTPGEG